MRIKDIFPFQEAQGFTPTESRSRLYYDFKREREATSKKEEESQPPTSPSKVKGMSLAEFMRTSGSPTKFGSPTKVPTGAGSPTKVTSPLKEHKQVSNKASEHKEISNKASISRLSSSHANGGTAAPTPPPPPPVILTCHPKSPASSPVRTLARAPSPEYKPKVRILL